jgi:hypothetical protein
MESKQVLIYIVGSKPRNMISRESMHKKLKNSKVCFYCGIKSNFVHECFEKDGDENNDVKVISQIH